MALTPEYSHISNFTDIIAELYTFLSGISGWIIDKYIQADINYINELTGPFVIGETITWAGGSGVITGLIDNGTTGTISFYLVTGIMPVDTTAISGATATADVSGAPSITTSNELYIHTIAGDTSAAHYSFTTEAYTDYIQRLVIRPSLGFDASLAIDAQPGAPTNSGGTMAYTVNHGTLDNFREGYIVANDNFFLVSATLPTYFLRWTFTYCYGGNVDKDFVFTGGQFIQGSNPHGANTPPSAMYYDNGVGEWYTQDGGAFADVGGKALVINQIDYPSAEFSYSHLNAAMVVNPRVLFVEHDGGFAPLARVHKFGFIYNNNDQLCPYGEVRLQNVQYLTIPTGTMESNHYIVESGAY